MNEKGGGAIADEEGARPARVEVFRGVSEPKWCLSERQGHGAAIGRGWKS